MKLTEIKTRTQHYFVDSSGNIQGEYKWYWSNGQLNIHCHFKDGEIHGEYKSWDSDGDLVYHNFRIYGKKVVDFLKEPHEYPSNSEDSLLFKLKYGTAPFLDEL